METVAQRLAKFASALKFEDLPSEVVHQVKRTIMDTVGCAYGGYDGDTSRIARELAQEVASSHPATVLCSGQKTTLDLAVFANDAMVRYLDYNDGYISHGGGHPSDSVSALLPAAEVADANGRELIVATALAYEVFCRFSDAWDYRQSGVDHVIHGGLASLVGAARLLRLNEIQIEQAINIYLAGNIALYQTRIGNVSMWKGCAYANASRNAVFAVQLAARGMTGPSPIFEGRNGVFAIVSRKPFELGPLGAADPPYRILKTHLKQFPLGNFSQTVVTAVLEARLWVSDPDQVAELHVHTTRKGLNIMADGPEKWRPANRETADHSIPFTAAVAFKFGAVEQRHFDEKYFLHDTQLLDLMSRIKCSASEEADRRVAEFNLCVLDVTLRSGKSRSFRVEYHRGHPRNPMSDQEVETKFRTLAGTMLGPAQINEMLDELWALERMPRAGRLAALSVPRAPE